MMAAGLCGCDEGVTDALACEAPRLLGNLAMRALRYTAALVAGKVQHSSHWPSTACIDTETGWLLKGQA
jgi:hypothetical protein